MGSIARTPGPTALSVLTAPGNPLSRISLLVPPSVLDSATPTDLANLSNQAAALYEVNGLYGGSVSNLFQSPDRFQPLTPGLSLLSAAYGLTPTSSVNPDLLREGRNSGFPTLGQSLRSLFGDSMNSSGNLVNIIG